MTNENARAGLKASTDSAHKRLHELPQFKSLIHGTTTLEEYAALMSGLLLFYRAVDAQVADACHEHSEHAPCYRYRPRAPLIKEDIAAIRAKLVPGPNGRRSTTQTPGLRHALPVIEHPSALAGVIYVVDGATMGGRLLNRAAARLLSEQDATGRSYWQWCETDGASHWKAALALIELHGKEQSGRALMTQSALETFKAFESQFTVHPSDDLAGAA